MSPTRLIIALLAGLVGSLTACTQPDVNTEPQDVNSELIEAVRYGQTETVKKLLDAGADVNARDNDGRTALMEVAARGVFETLQALLKAGAQVNPKDKNGQTALMDAARADSVEMVEALISRGADIHAKNGEGKTAYIQAGSRSGVARLLERAQQKFLSELIEAAQNGQIERVKTLLQASVDVNARPGMDEPP